MLYSEINIEIIRILYLSQPFPEGIGLIPRHRIQIVWHINHRLVPDEAKATPGRRITQLIVTHTGTATTITLHFNISLAQ